MCILIQELITQRFELTRLEIKMFYFPLSLGINHFIVYFIMRTCQNKRFQPETLPSFKLLVSLGFIMPCYVIFSLSICLIQPIGTFMIT